MAIHRFASLLIGTIIAAASFAGCKNETIGCGDGAGGSGGVSAACEACDTALQPCLDACSDDACKLGCNNTYDSCATANCDLPHPCG